MVKSLHTLEYQHFRELLIGARNKSNLTQLEVSTRLSRPQSFVAKYERGERRLDLIEYLEVCNALDVDPHEVLSALQSKVAK
jgi:transcriptional regulator with XRE-family HTH domain